MTAAAALCREGCCRLFTTIVRDRALATGVERDVLRDVVDLVADDEPAAAT